MYIKPELPKNKKPNKLRPNYKIKFIPHPPQNEIPYMNPRQKLEMKKIYINNLQILYL